MLAPVSRNEGLSALPVCQSSKKLGGGGVNAGIETAEETRGLAVFLLTYHPQLALRMMRSGMD